MGRLLRAKETGLVAVILVLGGLLAFFGGSVTVKQRDPATGRVIGQAQVNKFLQPANIDNILKNSSWTAVMAVGATILIISGGIDLSVGSIYCLAAVAGAMVLRAFGPGGDHPNTPAALSIALGIAATLAVATLAGLGNGLMVVLLRVHPFIITLGTMSIYRGIAYVRTKGLSVTDFPPVFGEIVRWSTGDITPLPIMVVLLTAAVGYVLLMHTVLGREIYGVGGNETACLFSGIRVGRVKVAVFTIAGLTAGVAAVITLGVFGAADSTTGRGYELDVIAAAVVGGASLSGGRGTALGAILGAIVIQLIANGIVILDIDSNYTEIIKGAVIIIAVVLDRFSTTLGQRRLVRA